MENLDPKIAKKLTSAMRKFGFDAFLLFAIQWNPKDKTEFFTTASNRIDSQEDLQALGSCIRETMKAKPSLISFIQTIIDDLVSEIKTQSPGDPLFPS